MQPHLLSWHSVTNGKLQKQKKKIQMDFLKVLKYFIKSVKQSKFGVALNVQKL